MPRIVPSQVVTFIAGFSLTVLNGNVKMSDLEPYQLSGTLDLIDQIPDELLTMDNTSYASFIQEKAHIRGILEKWHADQNAQHQRYGFPFVLSQSPLAVISAALSRCPDESPAPSTSELNFIADIDLRTSLRNDLGSSNRALSNGEWKASTVLAGSVIEALLLWALRQRNPTDVAKAAVQVVSNGTLTKKLSSDLEQWFLPEYIEVATELGIIEADTAIQTRLAKKFRNLIHPGLAERVSQKCDRATALSAVAGAEHVIRDLTA